MNKEEVKKILFQAISEARKLNGFVGEFGRPDSREQAIVDSVFCQLFQSTILTRREFLKLPMDERRKLLAEQANDPEIIAYYR